jgi:hypothetical protein
VTVVGEDPVDRGPEPLLDNVLARPDSREGPTLTHVVAHVAAVGCLSIAGGVPVGAPVIRGLLLGLDIDQLFAGADVHTGATFEDAFKVGRRCLDLDLIVAIVRALVGAFGQLPADLATFTGRDEELAWLIDAATHQHDDDANTVMVSAIEGMACWSSLFGRCGDLR